MERTDNMPLWVFLAFSSIPSRKGALILIWSCVAFSVYCIPWSLLFAGNDWIVKVFMIDDWSWISMMVPIIIWYWLSLKWVDNHSSWDETRKIKE
ncbi:MAG: hypothetical protein OEY61_10875 [Gammaproteobacteria bacterium]|nr:hypothetical protein [Gammaproteobacteria bacterium]